MRTSDSQESTDTEMAKIAWLSTQSPAQEFLSLMHHINVGSLQRCFDKLDGQKAVGADRVSKAEYGENLLVNLEELITRMKRMGYRPQPVRQVLIPKEGKPGATRPLGISNFEDKLVQKRMQEILESIYAPIFLDCSYGFRPGLGCHDAIKDLHKHLYSNEVEVVIDVDLANFFGTIDHKLLEDMLQNQAFGNAFECSKNAACVLMVHPIYKQYGRPLSPPTIAHILYFATRLNVTDLKELLRDERVLVELLFRMIVSPSECYGKKMSIPLLLGLMTYRDVIWRMLQPNDVQKHGVEISEGKLSTVNDIRAELLINIYHSLNQPEENQHILYKVFFKESKHSKNQDGFFKTTNVPTISALKNLVDEVMRDNFEQLFKK